MCLRCVAVCFVVSVVVLVQGCGVFGMLFWYASACVLRGAGVFGAWVCERVNMGTAVVSTSSDVRSGLSGLSG